MDPFVKVTSTCTEVTEAVQGPLLCSPARLPGSPAPRDPCPDRGSARVYHSGASMSSDSDGHKCDFLGVTTHITSKTVRSPWLQAGTYARSQGLCIHCHPAHLRKEVSESEWGAQRRKARQHVPPNWPPQRAGRVASASPLPELSPPLLSPVPKSTWFLLSLLLGTTAFDASPRASEGQGVWLQLDFCSFFTVMVSAVETFLFGLIAFVSESCFIK